MDIGFNVKIVQTGKELGDLVALEKLEEGGEQKKQLQARILYYFKGSFSCVFIIDNL